MKREEEQQPTSGQRDHPGEEPVAKNPNPRANENIRVRSEDPGTEKGTVSDEVGSEITDGEDG